MDKEQLINALTLQYELKIKKLMSDFVMCPEVAATIRAVTFEYLKNVEYIQTKELT